MLQPILIANGVPALAAAVLDSTRTIAMGAVGIRKRGDSTPVTRSDRFHLGSNSKAITAMLAAVIVEGGAVGWDDPLPSVLSGWTLDPSYQGATPALLLSHRSGAPREADNDVYLEMRQTGDPAVQRRVASQAMLARAGAGVGGFEYSNLGYMIAGALLQERTSVSWEELIRTRLFEPLALTQWGFGSPAADGTVNQPWGHFSEAYPPSLKDVPPAMGPAATIHCSIEDWGKLLQVHLRGARGEAQFLSRDSFQRLHVPEMGYGYAMGWNVTDDPLAGVVLHHQGTNQMFLTEAWIIPQRDRVFVVATNEGGSSAAYAAVEQTLSALRAKYAP